MDLSVIICTYNRAVELRRTLDSFCLLTVPTELQWEVIVVDNNSADATRTVCEECRAKLSLRYIFEPQQGQTFARNRGIRASTAELVVFTDDDVDVDPHWLACLWDAARRTLDASVFGGRGLPRWDRPPPDWLAAQSQSTRSGV